MYLGFAILALKLAFGNGYAAYEIFKGFNATASPTSTQQTTYHTDSLIATHRTNVNNTTKSKTETAVTPIPEKAPTTRTILPVPFTKFLCPEYEKPSNIGAYLVPTQRDIALLVRKTLTRLFNKYHEKALYFLRDIKEATKATASIERKCHGYGADSDSYKRCVRQVGNRCEVITKGLVRSLERQRADVAAFTNGTVCNVKGLKADPVELIKTLAKEEASLDFALPGFLRLMSACSTYCDKMEPEFRPKKPLRHMTDQDLVVKHFLTKKNYIQLLKGTK